MSDDILTLQREFQQGRMAALLDGLALCHERSTPPPAWIVDALLAKRDAIATALKPPPQHVHAVGLDMALCGGIDADRGIEQVAAGKGVKIVAKRIQQEQLRLELDPRDAAIEAIYRGQGKKVPRQCLVTETWKKAKAQGIDLSRSQVARILKRKGVHRRLR